MDRVHVIKTALQSWVGRGESPEGSRSMNRSTSAARELDRRSPRLANCEWLESLDHDGWIESSVAQPEA